MYIIQLTADESKSMFKAIADMTDESEIQQYVQQFYDAKADKVIQSARANGNTMPFHLDDGSVAEGSFRRNGRRNKTVCVANDTMIVLRLARIRSDDLHCCETILLVWMVPYTCVNLIDLIRMILEPSKAWQQNRYTNYTFSILCRIRRLWKETWKSRVAALGRNLSTAVEDIFQLAEMSIRQYHQHLFQNRGFSCSSEK